MSEPKIDQETPKVDQETQDRLDRIGELAKELEQALVEVMLPSTLEFPPGPYDIEGKVVKFFDHCIDNVMFIATQRVIELWPKAVKDQEVSTALLNTLLDTLKDSIPAKTDKKLN